MAVFTERQAIKQRMEEIRQERRELLNEYYSLIDRLRELDNEEKEAIDSEAIVGSLTEAVKTIQQLIPHVPVSAVLEHVSQKIEQSKITITTEKPEKEVAPKPVITYQQRRDEQRVLTERKRSGRLRKEYVLGVVIEILKDKGTPVKLQTIEQELAQRVGKEYSKPYMFAMLDELIKNNKVEKPMRGFYQYRF